MFAWSWILKASLCCMQCVCRGSSCLGSFSKPRPSLTTTLRSPKHSREARRRLTFRDNSWWSSSPNEMDNNGNTSRQQRNSSSLASGNHTQDTRATVNSNANNTAFVNHALVLWTERRQEWVGTRQRPRPTEPREPVIRWGAWDISWSATYEDLLATSRPFPQRIPLPEMVDFLVDVWEQEGLYE